MSCQKTSYILEKEQVSKISLWEKISMKFHLLICALCRKYKSDSKILGKILKGLHQHKTHHHLSDPEKSELKKKLNVN